MKATIEYLLTLNPVLPPDDYRSAIVEALTPPAWYHPFQRARFYDSLDTRIGLVMSEYAKDLLNALGGNTKTDLTNNQQLDSRATPPATTTQTQTTTAPYPEAGTDQP